MRARWASPRLLTALLVLWHQAARADEPAPPEIPARRWVYSILTGIRANPVGLETQLRVGWQGRLSARRSLLFYDTYLFAGLQLKQSPAYTRVAAQLEVQPLAVMNLRISAEAAPFYGAFGIAQSFPTASADASDRALEALRRAGTAYATMAWRVAIEPTVQARLGALAVRNRTGLEYWRADLRAGDRVFYEQDTLVPGDGWLLSNDLDVVVLLGRLVAGARWSVLAPLTDDAEAGPAARGGQQRLGPIFAYTFFDRPGARWNRPTLIFLAGFYLGHRYRTGQAESEILPGVWLDAPGFPYLGLGLAWEGDLVSWDVRAGAPARSSRE